MPFTTIRRYKDCISGNRTRRLTEGGREKKEDVVRRREGGPDLHFVAEQSPQSSTFDQTLIYSLLFSSTSSISSTSPIQSFYPAIHPPLKFIPPTRMKNSKKKKSYEQFAASVSARPSVGSPKKIHPLLLTRQGFDCRKFID